jgi:hypothetical protein
MGKFACTPLLLAAVKGVTAVTLKKHFLPTIQHKNSRFFVKIGRVFLPLLYGL